MPRATNKKCVEQSYTSSTQHEDILCFEHCDKKVICVKLPDSCPVCQTSISQCKFQIPPFKIPSPFSRAQDHPCTIVIKPTKGDFLRDYRNHGNLHIAVTNSKGFVIEYDMDGIHRDRTSEWNRCITIDIVQSLDPDLCSDPDWSEYWDVCLENTLRNGQAAEEQKLKTKSRSQSWSKEDYHEEEHNCFEFVLNFLKSLKQDPFSSEATNKLEFCRKFILPKTTLAGKYICLHRKIIRNSESDEQDGKGLLVLEQKFKSSTEIGSSDDSSLEERIILTHSLSSDHQDDIHNINKNASRPLNNIVIS